MEGEVVESTEVNEPSIIEDGDADFAFGMDELGVDKLGQKKEKVEKKKREPKVVSPVEDDEEVETEGEEEDDNPFTQYFKKSSKAEDDDTEDEDDEIKKLVKPGDPDGYSKRVKEVIKQRKQVEAQLSEQREQYESFQSQVNQYQQQVQQQMEQLRIENARMQAYLQHQQQQAQQQQRAAFDPDDPVESLKRQMFQEVGNQYNPKIQALEQQLQAYQRQAAEQEKQTRIRAKQTEFSQSADRAVRENLLSYLDAGDVDVMTGPLKELVMAKAWGHDTDFESASRMVLNDMMQFAKSVINANKAKNKNKTVTAPKTAPQRKGGTGSKTPTLAELNKAGFDTYLDYAFAGKPPL